MNPTEPRSIRSTVAIAAIATLAVTALRLGLEFGGAPNWVANKGPGGGGVVGIAWLPFVFGPWFAFVLRVNGGTIGLWKRLAKTLLVYGFLARLPVALLTIPAVLGEWGTHYDAFPASLGTAAKIGLGFAFQLVFWGVIWTAVSGTLAGLAATAARPATARPAA